MTENADIKNLKNCLPRWLQEHGLPLDKAFRCLSPAHRDAHPSMRYNKKNQTVHCFSCGVTMDIFQLVGQEEGLNGFRSQLVAVRRKYGVPGAAPLQIPVRPAGEVFSYKAGEGRPDPYFTGRGLSDELVQRFGLRVEQGYAVLPVFGVDGVCRSVCRRAIDPEDEPRYKNSRGGMQLWNGEVLAASGRPVFVTEGIFDALSLEEVGCTAVALCGAANTGRFLQALDALAAEERPGLVVLAGDADEAGQAMNGKLQAELETRGIPSAILLPPAGCKDMNEALLQDRDVLQRNCAEAAKAGEPEPPQTLAEEFMAYLAQHKEHAAVSTGLAAVDKALDGGLHSGLAVLGAVSAMGKTTLMLQLADTIAAQGRSVLFVTIEMSRWELLGKSFVRGTTERARALLDGKVAPTKVRRLVKVYERSTGGRVNIWEPDGPLTPVALRQKVADLCAESGEPPVIFLDYLQLMAPEKAGMTEKQTTDAAVAELKQLARQYDTPVITASSLNREAYRPGSTEPTLSAFKESGSVEYSADLLLVLKYRPGQEESTDTRRQLELHVLKNRFGSSGVKIPLEYTPAEELFSDSKTHAARTPGKRNVIR